MAMADTDEDLEADVLGAPPHLADELWSRFISHAVESEPDEGTLALLPSDTRTDDAGELDDQFDAPATAFTADDDTFDTQNDLAVHHDDPNHVDHDAGELDQ